MSNEQQNTREAANQLKDCPFCGSSTIHKGFQRIAKKHYAECMECLALIHGFDTYEECVAAWNRRDGAASIDRVEIVREAFADLEVEVNDSRWKSGWRSTEEIKRAMDAVLAAMEKGK